MDEALKLHIDFLEQQLQLLNQKLKENGLTAQKRNRIDSEIRAAQLALEHYQKAFADEHSLRR
jgi:hypothetical protein